MKKELKEKLQVWMVILCLLGIVIGIGSVKYYIWRAEHPLAKTWTFFIPRSR